jgi:ubiquinone/menaquinone biosynthesis C-methylase UbiE
MSNIFSISRLISHRNRSIKHFPKYDYLFDYAANSIIERLLLHKNSFKKIIEIGSRSNSLTQKLEENFLDSQITICDSSNQILNLANQQHKKYLIENESILLDQSEYDLIVSSLYLHWINNLPLFLTNIHHLLKEKGLAILAFVGGDSLSNLRKFFIENELLFNNNITPHISPFIRQESLLKLCQDINMQNIIIDTEIIEIEYRTCFDLMKELSLMGESNCLISSENYTINKKLLHESKMLKNFTDKFEIIYCSYLKH